LTEVDAAADLNVRYTLGSANRREVETYPAGWYGTRVIATHFTEGTLVLNFRDAKTHGLIWRAIVIEDKGDPMKLQKKLDDMVKKAINGYPPKKK
jgi:hypothetical protein